MKDNRVCICIPSRLGSTRLPNKPLVEVGGLPLIVRVANQAAKVALADQVIVLTDHQTVIDTCNQYDIQAVITKGTHESGTARIIEFIENTDFDIIINLQGDEPIFDPEVIDQIIAWMKLHPESKICTLIKQIEKSEDLFDYNKVKVVTNVANEAMYFSRQAIPAQRDLPYHNWLEASKYFHHIGVYGYRKNALKAIKQMAATSLEQSESLEQLRWLYHGMTINCLITDMHTMSIDTQEDLVKAEIFLKEINNN